MIIKSIMGRTIYETASRTMRAAVEECAEKGVDLARADLRRARLARAALDGLKARGACFWGADLKDADLGFADLRDADFRAAILEDTCFAHSDLAGADLRGAYFSRTLLEGAVLSGARISCPSFWGCDITRTEIRGLRYTHMGESEWVMAERPLIIRGRFPRLVLSGGICVQGQKIFRGGPMNAAMRQSLTDAKKEIDRVLSATGSRNAGKPIPKIGDKARRP